MKESVTPAQGAPSRTGARTRTLGARRQGGGGTRVAGTWSPLGDSTLASAAPSGGAASRIPRGVARAAPTPQSEGQAAFWDAMRTHSLTLALGPAGTGKTYLAVSAAVEALEGGRVDRIVLSRPAVTAGETLGFLPGDVQEKMAPYLRPLYDALVDRLGSLRLRRYLAEGVIEIAPVAYMRGRTLNNAFVIIDEAQNCTYTQLKMLLTRLGWRSLMVVAGDPDQSDLLGGVSGLNEVAGRLEGLSGVAVLRLTEGDVVRHPLVARMLEVL